MSGAILFEGDEAERLGSLSERPRRLMGSQLLWVDVDRSDGVSADEVADAFGLNDATRDRLASSEGGRSFKIADVTFTSPPTRTARSRARRTRPVSSSC
jgi:hypothetical protein